MRFQNLNKWLGWQTQLHPASIELGLNRAAAVWQRIYPHAFPTTVITVAGTNGKGSCVAMLDAILRTAGYRVGCYTSPHLLRYNERIRINGKEVGDATICHAFERIDQLRDEILLTYFEFSTLAALDIFSASKLDIVILEVGLGGRLDAVNIIDPDVALITSVDIDHTDWLGDNLEQIALEKAGILRANKPAVFGAISPPLSLVQYAAELDVPLTVAGTDFSYKLDGLERWSWRNTEQCFDNLSLPVLKGTCQLQNAAATLQAISLLPEQIIIDDKAISRGLQNINLLGRFQVVPGSVDVILDVAHNPAAAHVLADSLQNIPCCGRTLAVFAMLADKDIAAIIKIMTPHVDKWFLGSLDGERGLSAKDLKLRIAASNIVIQSKSASTVEAAYKQVLDYAEKGDRVLVFGSFLTVSGVLQQMERDGQAFHKKEI